jgi:hypothetical protein
MAGAAEPAASSGFLSMNPMLTGEEVMQTMMQVKKRIREQKG